ncbi:hypothetical protein NliqN6_2097 [Naganishia liquefaciens]|uniref:4-coumarate--CoA ligase family protein n=1 Tax=Naganishia liquefaciens TaxID=104408 RepID=A0A8H3TS92_9TREE|nr:hypothetical protein NliqN6_2097 [Naganishia liquefaciens]
MTIYESTYPPMELAPHNTIFRHHLPVQPRFPDYPAFIDAITGRTVTLSNLRSSALQLGVGLRNKLGLKEKSRVLVYSPNSVDFPIIFFGCQSIGVITSLANASYTAKELAHQIRDGQADLAFVHPAIYEAYIGAIEILKKEGSKIPKLFWAIPDAAVPAEIKEKVRDVQAYDTLFASQKEVGDFGGVDLKSGDYNDCAVLCYSSGTTGLAKGVMTTHENLNVVGQLSRAASPPQMKNGNGQAIIGVLPMFHIYGMVKLINYPLTIGVPVVVLPKFIDTLFFSTIQKHKITYAFLVPPIILHLANNPLAQKFDLSSLRNIMSGAAPLGAGLTKKVKQRFPKISVSQGYGLTETTAPCHAQNVEDAERHLGSCGKLLPNLQVRLVDIDLKDVKKGTPGEICIRGPTIMKGYWNNEKATKESFFDGDWYRTGDIAQIDDEGNHFIVDRLKELIKYKGFQVPPADLEALLLSHPKVDDVGVIGITSVEKATELPRAYVVPSGGLSKLDDAAKQALSRELTEWVAANVANHKQLRGGCVLIEAIPKSAAGKILRKELREKAKVDDQQASDAQNSTVKRMAKL